MTTRWRKAPRIGALYCPNNRGRVIYATPDGVDGHQVATAVSAQEAKMIVRAYAQRCAEARDLHDALELLLGVLVTPEELMVAVCRARAAIVRYRVGK